MNGFAKKVLILFGVMVVMSGLVVFLYVQSMEPDEPEADRVVHETKPYITKHFKQAEMEGVFYDATGTYSEFDYAVQLNDRVTGTDFFVYVDQQTNQVTDTYLSEQWSQELTEKIRPLVENIFGPGTAYKAVYYQDDVQQLKLKPSASTDYQKVKIPPFITITLQRDRLPTEEQNLTQLATALKKKKWLRHGNLATEYINEKGVLREDEIGFNTYF
ncbi:hypothetical protein [Exiguobacterium antarcticum]|uniref:Uncharacterized protein n=1 Tax=Exiguobacterium antarcticum TaxID=132920 RepID=A0ABT6R698_9BACL|nr:hypothetical protein [Exiguobacterium antarcticum]AFS70505.1 Hypothetical protein Eab7_1382 [Exiguobacterium antarcticum B7]MDI3236328.1 hypothetical protein [Exiguobacterium antarcticum]